MRKVGTNRLERENRYRIEIIHATAEPSHTKVLISFLFYYDGGHCFLHHDHHAVLVAAVLFAVLVASFAALVASAD